MRKLLWGVLGAALIVKAAYLFFSRSSPFFEPLLLDPEYYHNWALRILKGGFAEEGVFYGLPLYPLFLALCYKIFGVSFLMVKIIQGFLGLLTIFFIYKIGEKIASQKAGLLAAGLATFYGPLFFHEFIFIPESLSLPLYAASLIMACVVAETTTVPKAAFAGFLFGLAALTKAGIILFVLCFVIFLVIRQISSKARTFFPPFACLAVFLLTLAPVTAHNVLRGKDFVFLTAHSGLNFYIGNNPYAEGVLSGPQFVGKNVEVQRRESRIIAERELGRTLKPSEISKYWSGKAWEFIREHPWSFLKLCLKKFVLFFDAREISDVEDYNFTRIFNPFLRLPWPSFALLGPLFLFGFVACFRAFKHRVLLVLWLACYVTGILLYFVNARYRLPLLSLFFPVAAAGVLEFFETLKARSWGKSGAYAAILLAGIWMTQAALVQRDWSRLHANAGDSYLRKNEIEKAIQFFQSALDLEPDYARVHLQMGVALTKMGRHEESKAYYARSIELDPTNAQAYNNLGMWYDRHEDLEQARLHFLKTVELEPDSALGHNNLGMIYGKLGQNEKAGEEFEMAIRLNPQSARAYTNLGVVRYQEGRVEEARGLWQKALEVDPEFEEARRALKLLGMRR
ncbi:MAG: tetratricopeptide repeat protein [Candidatus Omnitrophota bacterium]